MVRILMIVSFIAVAFIGAAKSIVNSQRARQEHSGEAHVSRTNIATPKPVSSSGVVGIKRAPNGHYEAEFKLNHTRVRALIDTGASVVALNKSTARRAGVHLTAADFTYKVNTANGVTMAAKATLSQVQIGSIRLRDVQAMVLEDKALNQVLIGMSFMNRLRGFEYKSNRLILKN